MKSILCFCYAVAMSFSAYPQTDAGADSLLIVREKIKWEALKTGQFGMNSQWFAPDFISIGYMPDGSVYRSEKANTARPTNPGEKAKLPPADFALSNFKIVTATSDVKVVTYQADGPLNLYATTTWAKRGAEWLSVFYQATKYK